MSDLLPNNATAQEVAISEAIDRPVPVVVREMWNPDTCPDNLLPWMAWAFSVDAWDTNWTDAQKRGAIKASVSVHEKKGTIGAMRTALDALGYGINVEEWFEKTPVGDPYTFGLTKTIDQVGIPTKAAFDAIFDVVESTKNLRSHMTGFLVRGVTGFSERYGAKVFSGETVTISAMEATVSPVAGLMYAAARFVMGDVVKIQAEPMA